MNRAQERAEAALIRAEQYAWRDREIVGLRVYTTAEISDMRHAALIDQLIERGRLEPWVLR